MSIQPTAINKICPSCRTTYPYKESHVCGAGGAVAEAAASGATGEGANDPLVGAVLGDRYHIESYLQGGGMGIVYRARHIVLDKPLAVKVMRKAKDEVSQQRFLLEAKSACQINHEHIVDITDYGLLDDGRPYLVMELLQGRPLDALVAKGPLSPKRACRIGEQLALGLQVVHDKGILHRDLKPSNVFLLDRRGQDFVKILDFGIAKVTGVAAPEGAAGAHRPTHEGTVLGTPEYMAPEQALGEEAEPRSDQYSLGCILYEMLCGTPPSTGDKPMLILMQHINGTLVPLRQRRPDVPPSLEAVVMKALSKEREHRFPSMRDLAFALEQEGAALSGGDSSGMMQAGSGSGLWMLQASGPRTPMPAEVPASMLVETLRRDVPAAMKNVQWPPPSQPPAGPVGVAGRRRTVLISGLVTTVALLGLLTALWATRRGTSDGPRVVTAVRTSGSGTAPVPAPNVVTNPAPNVATGPVSNVATNPVSGTTGTEPTTNGSDDPTGRTTGDEEGDELRVLFVNTNPVAVTVACPGIKPCSAQSNKSCELRLNAATSGKCEAKASGYKMQSYPVADLRGRAKNGKTRQVVQLDARGLGQIKL